MNSALYLIDLFMCLGFLSSFHLQTNKDMKTYPIIEALRFSLISNGYFNQFTIAATHPSVCQPLYINQHPGMPYEAYRL